MQYDRLANAELLDPDAAKKSASWGAFQVMGFNYDRAGYKSVDEFVTGMQSGVQAQLNAFVAYIRSDSVLLKATQTKDGLRLPCTITAISARRKIQK